MQKTICNNTDNRLEGSSDVVINMATSLQPYNTLAVPARAAYLCRCSTIEQLESALTFARNKALTVLILGEGSNTVFSKDFDGLVILNRLTGIQLLSGDDDSLLIKVASGENWHDFVRYSLEQHWYGLENLALIPGLVGAAPIQNIGAYGVEVKDLIESVNYVQIDSGQAHVLNNLDCQFAYRDSIFKHELQGECSITSVVFRLRKTPKSTLNYPALAARFNGSPSPMDIFNAVCDIRKSKLPMPDDIPNAGSFFKNPIVDQVKFEQLKKTYSNLVAFPINGGGAKLAAGWLIEQAGWKEKSIGGVYVHQDQALVLVNPNHKKGDAILILASAIQADIKIIYGVTLEIEPRIY